MQAAIFNALLLKLDIAPGMLFVLGIGLHVMAWYRIPFSFDCKPVRRNRMKKILLLASVGLMISAPAFASENQSYVAIDIGQSKAKDACARIPAGVVGFSCSDTATSFRFAGGYGFNKNFGVEVSYSDYGKASTANGILLGVPVTEQIGATALQLVGTGALPLNDQFALTAKAGLAAVSVDASATIGGIGVAATASNNNFVWGIGAEFAMTPSVSLRVNYEDLGTVGDAATTGRSNLNNLSAGLMLKF